MAENKGVITVVGRRKICMAHSGDASLPAIVKMAWGDGGVDENGIPKLATGNEIGLFDEDGELIAYRSFMRKGKDEDIPQVYDMDEIF